MKLKDILQKYVNDNAAYLEQKGKLEQQIVRRQKKLDKLEHPSWVKNILKPIAEAIISRLGGWQDYEIMGPFGLTHETSIYFYKDGVSKEQRIEPNNFLAIHFRPTDLDKGEIKLVDVTKNTKTFNKGTSGEVNGMNHPTIPMKESISELMIFLNEQNNNILSKAQYNW